MSVAELLTKVRTITRRKTEQDRASYAEVVTGAATNKPLTPEKVAEVLERSGRTADEFAADVERKAERLRLRAVADAGPKAEAEQATVRATIATLDKKLADFTAAIQAEAGPHHARLRSLEDTVRQASSAETELTQTYPKDGPARVRLAELSAEVTAAEKKVKQVRDMVNTGRASIGQQESEAARHPGDARYTDELAKLRARVAGYEAELAAADREYRRLIDEQARTFEAMKVA